MWSYIAGGVFLALAMYFIVQGIRCGAAVRESKNRLAAYNAQTAALSYGEITYVDSGEGEVILSVHGIFGGYDQASDTCKDFCSDYRNIALSGGRNRDGIYRGGSCGRSLRNRRRGAEGKGQHPY